MDGLLSACVEEVALEGRGGCRVQTLWQRLEARLHPIPDALKPILWAALRGLDAQIRFTTGTGLMEAPTCVGRRINRRSGGTLAQGRCGGAQRSWRGAPRSASRFERVVARAAVRRTASRARAGPVPAHAARAPASQGRQAQA